METSKPAMNVSLIDIGPFLHGSAEDKARVAASVRKSCEESGFLTIIGHGIDPELIDRVRDVGQAFFGLDREEKRKVQREQATLSRGYAAVGDIALAYSIGGESPPDLQESFVVGPFNLADDPYYTSAMGRAFFCPNIWPKRPPDMRHVLETYFQAMEALADDIMRIFAAALDLDVGFFLDRLDRAISTLKVVHYPGQTARPLQDQLRAGAHTDYGTLTILLAEDKPGGLQVQGPAGEWIDVHPPPDSFVINIGDLMMRWSNDRWRSTLHRVVNPPSEHAMLPRLSVVFFQQPNYDAEIRCLEHYVGAGQAPKYPPITAGEHWRIKQSMARRSNAAEGS